MSRQRGPVNHRGNLYGNQNGLPGLPQSKFSLGGPRRPPPPPHLRGPAPPPPQARPILNNHPPQPSPPVIAQPDPLVGRRIDLLEQRLNATEQSNRALLDELMRLQQDLKMNVKKNEMGLVEEKEARSRLEAAVRQSQNRTYEVEDRARRCEDGVKENRNAVQQISSHMRSIEKAISSSQQEQLETRSNSAQRLQEYRHEVMKMNQSKEQLERLCFSLRDEMREASAKVDNVSQELSSLENNVKLQARLMEDTNNKINLAPKVTKSPDENNALMTETVRMALEGKIIQMNSTIQNLTERLNQEGKKRERVETDVNIRLNELLEDYGSSKVEKDKEMRDFDEKMKELQAGFSASEKQRILMEISSVAQELSRKMDQKEAKLRDDTVNKLTVIEATLQEENKRRATKEKALQESIDAQMRESKMMGEDGTNSLKKHIDQHEAQTREKLGELTNQVNNVDTQMRDHKLEQEKVLTAEIKERQNAMKVLGAKIEDVDDRQRTGIASLQSTIGDIRRQPQEPGRASPDYDERARRASADKKSQPRPDGPSLEERARRASADKKSQPRPDGPSLEEIQRIQDENAEGIREQIARDMSKMDKRLGNVETKIKQQDDRLENRLQSAKAEDQEAASIMGDKMQQKIDNVIFSQERLKKQVDSLQTKVQDTPKGVTDVKEEVEEAEKRLSKKIDLERKERLDDVEDIRGDIQKIIGEKSTASVPSLARLNQDVDETQTGMKKLAEAVHVVKTSLADRVKTEIKVREQECAIIRRDVDRLNTKYSELRSKVKA